MSVSKLTKSSGWGDKSRWKAAGAACSGLVSSEEGGLVGVQDLRQGSCQGQGSWSKSGHREDAGSWSKSKAINPHMKRAETQWRRRMHETGWASIPGSHLTKVLIHITFAMWFTNTIYPQPPPESPHHILAFLRTSSFLVTWFLCSPVTWSQSVLNLSFHVPQSCSQHAGPQCQSQLPMSKFLSLLSLRSFNYTDLHPVAAFPNHHLTSTHSCDSLMMTVASGPQSSLHPISPPQVTSQSSLVANLHYFQTSQGLSFSSALYMQHSPFIIQQTVTSTYYSLCSGHGAGKPRWTQSLPSRSTYFNGRDSHIGQGNIGSQSGGKDVAIGPHSAERQDLQCWDGG